MSMVAAICRDCIGCVGIVCIRVGCADIDRVRVGVFAVVAVCLGGC